jgi:hypothetical protein
VRRKLRMLVRPKLRMIRHKAANPLRRLVGAGRFELPTPCSRSKCATRLRYAPPDLVVQDFHWKASSRVPSGPTGETAL